MVFLCDQDDIWNKDKISLMVKEFHKSPSIELLASNYEILDFGRNDKVKIKDVELDNGAVVPFSLKNKSISVMRPGCTFAVKRELIVLLEKYDIDRFGMIIFMESSYDKRNSISILKTLNTFSSPRNKCFCS